jgi:hypothetical protein
MAELISNYVLLLRLVQDPTTVVKIRYCRRLVIKLDNNSLFVKLLQMKSNYKQQQNH